MATVAPAERSARDRILDTVSQLFYRDGYHAVGIDTIVERSGVAKMTLYRHFPSKDDLIAAYLERANAEFWDWLDGEITGVDDPHGEAPGGLRGDGQAGNESPVPGLHVPGRRVRVPRARASRARGGAGAQAPGA